MDYLQRLADNARSLVRSGYYAAEPVRSAPSLRGAIEARRGRAVIPEVKFASPTMDTGRARGDFPRILADFIAANPVGLSVLAEPNVFGGGVALVRRAAASGLPVLMKDIVVDGMQVDAAAGAGASAVLLIAKLFRVGYAESLEPLLARAHEVGREVVLEVNTPAEWDAALRTDADLIGINNRDLATMAVDLGTTERILARSTKDRPVIAMSGIETRTDVARMFRAGADAVLVGTSLMRAPDPAAKLRELIRGG